MADHSPRHGKGSRLLCFWKAHPAALRPTVPVHGFYDLALRVVPPPPGAPSIAVNACQWPGVDQLDADGKLVQAHIVGAFMPPARLAGMPGNPVKRSELNDIAVAADDHMGRDVAASAPPGQCV